TKRVIPGSPGDSVSVPSCPGSIYPRLTHAANTVARSVLPVPGSPSNIQSLARATYGFQSHSISRSSTSCADITTGWAWEVADGVGCIVDGIWPLMWLDVGLETTVMSGISMI